MLVDFDSLRRSDFVRWLGARCAVVFTHFKQRAPISKHLGPADKSARPFGWGISPRRGRYAACPMAHASELGHRAAQRAYPGAATCSHARGQNPRALV